jgi:predicted nicotinamide N-methyase
LRHVPRSVGALRAALERRFRTTVSEVTVADRTLRILHPANSDDLISEADYVLDERLPYWADVWPAGQVLAARLLRERGDGRRLLELGCGAGLVTAAAALAGFAVTATDYYEDATRFARVNAWTNARAEISARHADWRHWPRDLGRFDLVVASDVLYEKEYATLVAEMVGRTLAPGGLAIIADPGRYAAPAFLEACAERRLPVTLAERVPIVLGEIRQTIDLYEVSRSATTSAMS